MPTTAKAVNVGALANDGTGDTLRAALIKLNAFNVCGWPFNAVGDGANDDRGAIAAADAAAVSFGGGYLDFPPGLFRIASDLTVTTPIRMAPGARLFRDSGVNVTLNGGAPVAARYPIFNVLAPGAFNFGNISVERVYPQWWGAVADGTTNDLPAILAAIGSISQQSPTDYGGEVFFATPSETGISYYLGAGATGIIVNSRGVVLKGATQQTILKYDGAGDAILFTAFVSGASQNYVACKDMAVVCTHAAANAYRMVTPRYARFENCYSETGASGATGSGFVIDPANNAAINTTFEQCTSSGFKKGFLFKGGGIGTNICIDCAANECFARSQGGTSGTGTVGFEFQGSGGCTVRGGGCEIVDRGVNLVSSPTPCRGVNIKDLRGESIAVYNYDIPADSISTVVSDCHWETQIARDLAPDTIVRDQLSSRMGSTRWFVARVTAVNGVNNILSPAVGAYGFAGIIELSGPTGAFSVGGFTPPTATGFAQADGAELILHYTGTQTMTLTDGNATAVAANANIRCKGRVDVVISGVGGCSARFHYSSTWGAWFLDSTS